MEQNFAEAVHCPNPNCGAENPPGAAYCNLCGTPLAGPAAGEVRRRSALMELRGAAVGLVLAGLVALYISFWVVALQPLDATPEEVQRWRMLDTVLYRTVGVIGAAFILAGVLCAAGLAAGAWLSLVGEILLAPVLLAMAGVAFWKFGSVVLSDPWNYVLVLLALISVGSAVRMWRLTRELAAATRNTGGALAAPNAQAGEHDG